VIRERILLLLSIKDKGVTFDHIYEKVSRDTEFLEKRKLKEEEVKEVLKDLVKKGLIYEKENLYYPSNRIDEELFPIDKDKLNRSYLSVWVAKNYYPHVADYLLPFLKGRAVSVVKVFSGKKDPIKDVYPIFVRYIKYKPKPVFLTIDSKERLMELIYDHCIDFIPYVHKLNEDKPDTFILDLDAGEDIKREGFELLKFVTLELKDLLKDYNISSMVKFSGSRGFQLWSYIDTEKIKGDIFKLFRNLAIFFQRRLEERLKEKKIESKFPFIKGEVTTTEVAHKELRRDKILIDYSSMKPFGDVRAPFSLHYKSLLVSLPIKEEEIINFQWKMAEPFEVIKNLDPKVVKISPIKLPQELLKEIS